MKKKRTPPKYVVRYYDGYSGPSAKFCDSLKTATAFVLKKGQKPGTKIYELGKEIKFRLEIL